MATFIEATLWEQGGRKVHINLDLVTTISRDQVEKKTIVMFAAGFAADERTPVWQKAEIEETPERLFRAVPHTNVASFRATRDPKD
jgi:hypothetical protein